MDEQPTFRIPEMSWGDSKQFALLQMRAKHMGDENATPDFVERTFAEIEAMIARFLVSVPQDWLVSGAPETLDWSDPSSLNWLKQGRMGDLQRALVNATSPQETAGN